jgi:hypothetical protein
MAKQWRWFLLANKDPMAATAEKEEKNDGRCGLYTVGKGMKRWLATSRPWPSGWLGLLAREGVRRLRRRWDSETGEKEKHSTSNIVATCHLTFEISKLLLILH